MWLQPVLLLMPFVALVTFVIMRAANISRPAPHFALPASLVLFLAFVVAALGEEIGWSGYAIDSLQNRWWSSLGCGNLEHSLGSGTHEHVDSQASDWFSLVDEGKGDASWSSAGSRIRNALDPALPCSTHASPVAQPHPLGPVSPALQSVTFLSPV